MLIFNLTCKACYFRCQFIHYCVYNPLSHLQEVLKTRPSTACVSLRLHHVFCLIAACLVVVLCLASAGHRRTTRCVFNGAGQHDSDRWLTFNPPTRHGFPATL